jgi:hypothetical protein
MRPFFENNVLQQQPFKPMIIVVDTTKAGSASNTFVLPIIKATSETVKIYWGDGTSSLGVNGDNTHVYAVSGVYTVKIESKIFGGLYFNNTGDRLKLIAINSAGMGIVSNATKMYYGCANLLSANIYNAILLNADASYIFHSCTALASVPLFDLAHATNAAGMFYQCSSLTTAPLLNLSNVTNTSTMFFKCSSLMSVPLFDLSKVTNAGSMFLGCTPLTVIPFFDLSNLISAIGMFYQCSNITTVPLFDLSKVTNASYMFYQCSKLTTVPLFDLSNLISATGMFYQCSKLTTVPLFDLSKVTNATSMFLQCSSLMSVPLFDLSSVTNAGGMFLGVTLTTQSYSDFLINLATQPLQSGVSFHGGNSKYNPTAAIARAYLISNFGWTITDGGAA